MSRKRPCAKVASSAPRTMLHYLTLGHLSVDPANFRKFVVVKPIDMGVVMPLLREIGDVDEQGNVTFGGFAVEFGDGYLACPWMVPTLVPRAEEFARRVHEATQCDVFDLEHRVRIDVSKLASGTAGRRDTSR